MISKCRSDVSMALMAVTMHQWMDRVKYAPLLSELALVVLLAWIVAGWLLPSNTLKPAGLAAPMASVATLPRLTTMLAVPLFGVLKVDSKPAPKVVAKPAPVVLPPLTLKLLGTVVAGPNSAAIIAKRAGARQEVFFIADTIQPGVVLKSVEVAAIVVTRAGRQERISLEQGAKGALAYTPAATPAPVRSNGIRNKHMNRAHVQRQLQNFPALLSQARVLPHFVNGKPSGYVITEIAPKSLYQQAGLQNGDIILSINGQRITGPKQAMSMYTSLKQANALDLEFMRGGQVQHTHYDIR